MTDSLAHKYSSFLRDGQTPKDSISAIAYWLEFFRIPIINIASFIIAFKKESPATSCGWHIINRILSISEATILSSCGISFYHMVKPLLKWAIWEFHLIYIHCSHYTLDLWRPRQKCRCWRNWKSNLFSETCSPQVALVQPFP